MIYVSSSYFYSNNNSNNIDFRLNSALCILYLPRNSFQKISVSNCCSQVRFIMVADEKRTVHECVHRHGGQVSRVEYSYDLEHTNVGAAASSRISVTRDDYQRLAAKTPQMALSFDQFLIVLRAFMMGKHAVDDIREAFRLLDTNHTNRINISELAAFMPLINVSPGVLLDHVRKVDQDGDYKLNLDEFTNFIKKGIGRELVFGHH
jgi:hypothetical protein